MGATEGRCNADLPYTIQNGEHAGEIAERVAWCGRRIRLRSGPCVHEYDDGLVCGKLKTVAQHRSETFPERHDYDPGGWEHYRAGACCELSEGAHAGAILNSNFFPYHTFIAAPAAFEVGHEAVSR